MTLLRQLITLAALSYFCIPASLQASASVTYCAQSNWMPFEGIRNDKHLGLIADYMARISQLTSLRFDVVAVDSRQQSLEFVESGQCSMAAIMRNAAVNRREITASRPFYEIPHVLVTRSETPLLSGYSAIGDRPTGVVEGFYNSQYLARYYPDIILVSVPSEVEGLDSLARGEVDVMVVSLPGANSYLKKNNDGALTIAGIAEPSDKLQFIFSSDPDRPLVNAINGAIATIPESKKVALLKKWNKGVLYETRTFWPYFYIGILLVLISSGLYLRHRRISRIDKVLVKKRREIDALQSVLLDKNRTIEFLSNHDAETGLYNRNHMIQKAEEEVARYRRFRTSASLVVIDLLSVNTQDGKPLSETDAGFARAMGRTCMTTVREVDVIARWSNDQIVLLCPQTDQADAHLLTNRLIERLEQMAGGLGYSVTLAAGIARLRDNWSFNDWYEQACSILHQARRNGGGVALLQHY